MKAIFDIGANDGFNGLVFAILNPDTTVFSFEPNPHLEKIILRNKKIFENQLKINLKNFTLIKKAASNKKKKNFFLYYKKSCNFIIIKTQKKIK